SHDQTDGKARGDTDGPQLEALARRHDQQDRGDHHRQRGGNRPSSTWRGLLGVLVAHRPQGENGHQHGGEVSDELHRPVTYKSRTCAAPLRSTAAAWSTVRSITSRAVGMSRTRSTLSPAHTTRCAKSLAWLAR